MADWAIAGVSDIDYTSYSDTAYNTFINLNGYAERVYNSDWGRNTGAVNNTGCYMFRVSLTLAQEIGMGISSTARDAMAYVIASSSPFIWYGCTKSIYGSTAFARQNSAEPKNLGDSLYYYEGSYIQLEGNWQNLNATGNFALASTVYSTLSDLITAMTNAGIRPVQELYPITYSYTNSIVSGPSEAAVGDTVMVSATPDVGYGITDASTQILVTNDDVAVPYTWDAANQRITFTMPQPAENRGGFGSTGQ